MQGEMLELKSTEFEVDEEVIADLFSNVINIEGDGELEEVAIE